jgi:hypothetical protein
VAKYWLQDCCQNKDVDCTVYSASDPWYPTRLLDVGTRVGECSNIRLCLSQDSTFSGEYVTLSHCWGKSKRLIDLDENNLERYRTGIEWSSLPSLFQDAVVATQRLGIKYLWIDCLCIMQAGEGFKKDWQTESAAMAKVYTNAYCNLASSAASDSDGSLFFDRDPSTIATAVSPC